MGVDDPDDRYRTLPDVRDGLTREERVVLYVLHETQKERGDRNVPTAMLWGRVCGYFYISPEDLQVLEQKNVGPDGTISGGQARFSYTPRGAGPTG
jgi:hypothetical protein